ncbi:hypothetical protein HUS23_01000 [Ectothiorhodospiraceae bacterium 2226]|nr:hypothetical protein HUS23_01000 [Ectothiorhodospiraceae bacterium 2226]
MATYLLLTLFGIAVGMTVVDPRSMDPAGIVPTATGLWTGVGLLVGAFIGGYVSARMSGLARLADGMLHGFVTWGTTTVVFAFLVATAWGTLLGGAFGALGHGLQGMSEVRVVPQNETRQVMMAVELETLLTGNAAEGAITPASLAALQESLWLGDREAALGIMVEQMGFAPDRAEQLVDPAMALVVTPTRLGTVEGAGAALLSASWWLFFAILLSMLVALWGGAIGVRSTGRRTSGEDVEVG